MKNKGFYLIFFLGLVLIAGHINAQDSSKQTPAWILYERGKAELERRDKKELGEAIRFFLQAIDAAGIFPEAEVALGDVYLAEGEIILAEKQYKKAYSLKNSFHIPQDKYLVLYKLAGLYKYHKDYQKMELRLKEILQDQSYNTNLQFVRSFMDIYWEKGLDHLFRLYRMSGVVFSTKAHAELGWFYYKTGKFDKSIKHSLFALNIIVTEAVIELRSFNPLYEYIDLKSFIISAVSRLNIREYLFETDIYRILYYLAAADYAAGHPVHAFGLWKFLAGSDHAGRYIELSQRQLKSPWIEPYINP